MGSEKLEKARKYEAEHEANMTDVQRPGFHLSVQVGWMNDPNGFSYYNGQYHLFYQYHPYSSYWGPMHWGHAVSKDLLHWEYLPVALAPDESYDKDGCFSGSAVALEDGRHLLMYTGVVNEEMPDGTVKGVQTQCIAIGDGIDYEKYEGNPVLDERQLPEGGDRFEFRDPKIWQQPDGTFRCVAGNCDGDRDGQILLYSSEDALHWKFEKILLRNNDRLGKMWECPDFFELDGKQVLLTSPQDMLPQDLEYHNGNGTVCFIGTYDERTETFQEESNQAVDYGIDFYAPQTVLAPDGRRIMIGWMQNWDTCNFYTFNQPWFGQMSIPRELSVKNGRLIQTPVRELNELRKNKVAYENLTFSGTMQLGGIKGRKVDMEVTLRPGDAKNLYQKFWIRFAQNDKYFTSLSFRPYESVLKVDRKFSGSRRAIIHQRRSQVRSENGCIKLRLILDNFSMEVFVNDGEHVMAATVHTDLSADGISFIADGSVSMDIVKYDL